MDALISKWGNSQGIRIPKDFLKTLGITSDTPLDIDIKNDSIVISKKYKHKTLKERVKESGVPLSFEKDIDWGEPVGNEVW